VSRGGRRIERGKRRKGKRAKRPKSKIRKLRTRANQKKRPGQDSTEAQDESDLTGYAARA